MSSEAESEFFKGYYPVLAAPLPGETPSAATHGLLKGFDGEWLVDEHVIAIDTSLMNDTNNTVERVMEVVRATLEADIARRASQAEA